MENKYFDIKANVKFEEKGIWFIQWENKDILNTNQKKNYLIKYICDGIQKSDYSLEKLK